MMIRSTVFVLLSFISLVFLLSTVLNFAMFLSTQEVRENKSDEHIFQRFTVDVCLVLLFMAQHSLMASKFFKTKMAEIGLEAITRLAYAFATANALFILMYLWQPIPDISFWLIDTGESRLLWLFFHILHWVLWIAIVLQVMVMQPLELVGVKQVYNFVKGLYPPSVLFTPKLQKLLSNMPHPGSGCFIAVLWLHPAMTFDRMILATVLTAYLFVGYGVTEGDYVYVRQYSASKYSKSVKSHVKSYDTRTYYLRGGSHAL